VLHVPADTGTGRWLLYVGGAGLFLAALLHLYTGPPAERSLYRARLLRWRPLVSPAGLVIVGLPWVAAAGAAGLSPLDPPSTSRAIGLAVPLLIFGPLPEEVGWRGVALPVLLRRRGPIASSLLLGGAWALWHGPLFLIPETYQAGLLASPSAAMLYMLVLLPQSVIYTALWIATGGSTLSAIGYHWMTNLSGEALQIPLEAEPGRFAVLVSTSVIAGWWCRRRTVEP
jgi:uncharacterized protein